MALYKITSNYGPGVEISPMLWVLGFHVRARVFIFDMYHLVALYQNTSNDGPGIEISPMLWVLGFT